MTAKRAAGRRPDHLIANLLGRSWYGRRALPSRRASAAAVGAPSQAPMAPVKLRPARIRLGRYLRLLRGPPTAARARRVYGGCPLRLRPRRAGTSRLRHSVGVWAYGPERPRHDHQRQEPHMSVVAEKAADATAIRPF